jgi:hypothetical protein
MISRPTHAMTSVTPLTRIVWPADDSASASAAQRLPERDRQKQAVVDRQRNRHMTSIANVTPN